MKIVVIGGTGLIGSGIVAKLKAKGHEAIAAARSTGVDTTTGEGLAEALGGADVVVDVSRASSYDAEAVMHFIQSTGRHLAAAEAAAGVGHHVALSVVGTERLQESGWFRAKLAQETLVKSSPVPWTIVRATQFFEFIRQIARHASAGDTVRLPPAAFQPIAADDVASAMVAAALAKPAMGTIEAAGPDRITLDEAVRTVLAHDGDARDVIADPQAFYFGARLGETTLLPGPDAELGSTRLDGWLRNAAPASRT